MLLETHDLVVGYGAHPVAGPLNFCIEKGDYVCIVGPNGAGKSTLVKTLLGLQAPSGGRIVKAEGLSDIGYLPQQTDIQKDFPATVWEIVRSGCVTRRDFKLFCGKAENARAYYALKALGLQEMKSKSFQALSGGQQQRVLLARGLCAAEGLLVADEPAAGLDAVSCSDMYKALSHLNRRHALTVVMITHDIEAAFTHASHILHVQGKDSFFGTPDAYRQSPLMASLSVFSHPMKGGHEHA